MSLKLASLLIIYLLQLGQSFNSDNLGGSECCELNGLTINEIQSKFNGGSSNTRRGLGPGFLSPQGQSRAFDFPGYGWGGWYKSIIYKGGGSYGGSNGGQQESSQYGQETRVSQFEESQSGIQDGGGSRGGPYGGGSGGGSSRGSGGQGAGVVCCDNSRGGSGGGGGGFNRAGFRGQ